MQQQGGLLHQPALKRQKLGSGHSKKGSQQEGGLIHQAARQAQEAERAELQIVECAWPRECRDVLAKSRSGASREWLLPLAPLLCAWLQK